jgi:hypothetical protein
VHRNTEKQIGFQLIARDQTAHPRFCACVRVNTELPPSPPIYPPSSPDPMYDSLRYSLYAMTLHVAIKRANKVFGLSVSERHYRVLLLFYVLNDREVSGWKTLETKVLPSINLSVRHLGEVAIRPLEMSGLLGKRGSRNYVTASGVAYLSLVNRLVKQCADDFLHENKKG